MRRAARSCSSSAEAGTDRFWSDVVRGALRGHDRTVRAGASVGVRYQSVLMGRCGSTPPAQLVGPGSSRAGEPVRERIDDGLGAVAGADLGEDVVDVAL